MEWTIGEGLSKEISDNHSANRIWTHILEDSNTKDLTTDIPECAIRGYKKRPYRPSIFITKKISLLLQYADPIWISTR